VSNGRARRGRLAVAGALPLVAGLLFGSGSAAAHANLTRTAPAGDTVLQDAPGEIAVWFDAAIDPNASGLTLLDRAGETPPEAP
jgi:methionine-rich copper-binding protein CopC